MKERTDRLVDEALVIEAQAGGISALDALVRRWQRRMHAYALRLLGRDDAAWDACQEAWMGIVKGLHKLDDPGAFAAWAYRIVTNKCKDRLSQEARRKWLNLELAGNGDAVHRPSRDTLEFREAFGLLPGHMQAVLTLRYVEGFAVGEIGAILDIPEGTIKSRLHRARAELKKILEK